MFNPIRTGALRPAALILVSLSLAACGSGSSDSPASATAVSAAGASGTAPATANVAQAATGAAPAPAASSPAPAAAPAPKSIVEVAASNPQFSSLVAALQFASENNDLVSLLSGAGEFTVFAPTNAAFDALAKELTGSASATAADLLVPANRALVRAVLQYHVLAAKVPASGIVSGRAVAPALGSGSFFKIVLGTGQPAIVDGRGRRSNITATDIGASNGVVHVLDRVILPANRSIVQLAAATPDFSTLVAVLQFASRDGDLVNLLAGNGAFTVFAPTNAAFDALAAELLHNPQATAAHLLTEANRHLLRDVLQYHVLGARVLVAEVPLGAPIDPVLAGNASFTIRTVGSGLGITDGRHRHAGITATDVFASNGVIHVIDRVILPPAQ